MGVLGRLGHCRRSLLNLLRVGAELPCSPASALLSRGFCCEAAATRRRAISCPWLPFSYNSNDVLTQRTGSWRREFHATGHVAAAQRDYYDLLGISKDASQDEVKKAFHDLAKKYHPDANKNNPAAKRQFQEIREAYETLRDPVKRMEYNQKYEFSGYSERTSNTTDNSRGYAGTGQDPFSSTFYHIFSEVFESDFQRHASDVQVNLSLSFSEAAKGCTKQLSFIANVLCESCYGRGYSSNAKPRMCPTCRGSGKVTVFPFSTTCNTCKGHGHIIQDFCLACGGAGVVEGTKDVDVTVPAGIDTGDVIHVPKASNSGGRGAQPGALHIKINVAENPIFSRDGADIYVESRISFTQAILGGKVDVPTLTGKIRLKIPQGVQPGQLLVLRGKGLPIAVGVSSCGDQYVRFRIHFPTSVNERQKAILEEFAKEEEEKEESGPSFRDWWLQFAERIADRNFLVEIGILILILFILFA